MSDLIQTQALTMEFGQKTVFKNLNLTLKKGQITSLLGANGVGKTTLVRLLIADLIPTAGQIISQMPNLKIGYVPQFRNIERDYPLSVAAFVGLNQLSSIGPFKNRAEKKRLKHVLEHCQLTTLKNQAVGRLSGGQKQRVYLAQALMNEPDLLILDESTASLDIETKQEVMQLVSHLNQEHQLTVLFVTHDIGLARQYTDQYWLLKPEGYEFGQTSELAETIKLD